MKDTSKTKAQLIQELEDLRKKFSDREGPSQDGENQWGGSELAKIILKGTEDIVLVSDLQGKYLYYNGPERYGLLPQDVIEKTPFDFFDQDTASRMIERIRQVAVTGRSVTMENQVVWNNEQLWFLDYIYPVKDTSERTTAVGIISRDITDLKRTETELRRSEKFFRSLIENAWDFISIIDKDGVVQYRGHSAEQLSGYTPEELRGTRGFDFVHPEDRPGILETFHTLLQTPGSTVHKEFRVFYKNGSIHVLEAIARNLMDDPDVKGVVVNYRDITERKKAEDSLRESEEKFRSLAEKSPNMIFINKGGKIVYVNEKCEEVMGYTREEFYSPDFNFLTLVAKDCWDLVKENFTKHLEGEDVPPYVYSLITKNGKRIEAIHATRLIQYGGERAILGIITDITEQKKAEEALKESEDRYRSLVETSPDVVMLMDPQMNITMVNQQALTVYGYGTQEEFIGKNAMDLVSPEDYTRAVEELKKMKNMETGRMIELNLIKKDGTTFPAETTAKVIYDSLGSPKAVIGVARDITERKRLERQFLQAQKMESVGRLAGGVAHDFNNILTVITSYGSIARASLPPGDPARGHIDEVLKAAERASNLTSQLLAFSRRQIIKPQTIDLNEVVLNMDKMLRRLIGEDILLVSAPASDLNLIKADKGQIEQVIINLVLNARDAMPQGGTVSIDTANVTLDEDDVQKVMEIKPGHYVTLTISDTGSGMSENIKAHLFEPFFTTKEVGKGTGLGLATVYGIIKQNNGHIRVSSETGQGTIFTVYFPQITEPLKEDSRGDLHIDNLKRTETVLVAEDDPSLLKLLASSLRDAGHTVLEAVNGLEAFRIAHRHPEEIHLLLTDVVMPKMNGKELADKLMTLNPRLKVLFISGYTDEDIIHHGVLREGINFLQKPFTQAALIHKLHEVLDKG